MQNLMVCNVESSLHTARATDKNNPCTYEMVNYNFFVKKKVVNGRNEGAITVPSSPKHFTSPFVQRLRKKQLHHYA